MSDPFGVQNPAGAGDTFDPVPAGQHFAGLAAVVFLPNRPGYMGGAPRNEVQLIWITPMVRDQKGQPRQVRHFCGWPDNPMHENANWAKFLKMWMGGQALTDEQKRDFNLRQVVGGRAFLTTSVETSKNDRRFAKVIAPGPVGADAPPIDYTGIVIRIPPYPDQVVIHAPGVRVELSQQQATQQAPAQPAAAQPAAPVAAQPAAPAAGQAALPGTTAPAQPQQFNPAGAFAQPGQQPGTAAPASTTPF